MVTTGPSTGIDVFAPGRQDIFLENLNPVFRSADICVALSTTFLIFSMLLRRFIFFSRKYFACSKSIIIFLPTVHSSANLKNSLTLQGYTFIMRPLQNAPFCPISVSGSNFNPQNTQCIPVVKIIAFLELESRYSGKHFSKVSLYDLKTGRLCMIKLILINRFIIFLLKFIDSMIIFLSISNSKKEDVL